MNNCTEATTAQQARTETILGKSGCRVTLAKDFRLPLMGFIDANGVIRFMVLELSYSLIFIFLFTKMRALDQMVSRIYLSLL